MTVLALLAMVLSLRVAISDLYARRVPNAWLLCALLAGAAWLLLGVLPGILPAGAAPVAPHVIGLFAGLVALLPFHLLRWMGAGDVKFFAVLGALLGWQALLPVWLGANALAGLHALAVLAWRATSRCLPQRALAWQAHASVQWHARAGVQRMHAARDGREGIPYAAYLGIAAIAWAFGQYLEGAA